MSVNEPVATAILKISVIHEPQTPAPGSSFYRPWTCLSGELTTTTRILLFSPCIPLWCLIIPWIFSRQTLLSFYCYLLLPLTAVGLPRLTASISHLLLLGRRTQLPHCLPSEKNWSDCATSVDCNFGKPRIDTSQQAACNGRQHQQQAASPQAATPPSRFHRTASLGACLDGSRTDPFICQSPASALQSARSSWCEPRPLSNELRRRALVAKSRNS